ncbi:MAG: hypothetical protein GAK35_02827 [Herbaspirillum frisingense]|uniref:Uncharacterized protein n=1 Tax=Herbaspirillum frisingense TaxID=92645 RepID=A0A7V8FVD5_9BURK|nr:MAG: hypothetical protein GAK35_02827 [Herbaspirillum frisingense]
MASVNKTDQTSLMEMGKLPSAAKQKAADVIESQSSVLPRNTPARPSPLQSQHGTPFNPAHDVVADMSGRELDDPQQHRDDQHATLQHTSNQLVLAKARQDSYDEELYRDFLGARHAALQSGDFTEARELYLQLQGIDTPAKKQVWQEAIEHGGKRYGRRGWPGLAINLIAPIAFPPAVSTFSRTPVGPKLAVGNAAATVALGVVSAVAGYQTLLHTTPVQDSAFRGSPDLAPVMKLMNDEHRATLTTAAAELDKFVKSNHEGGKLAEIRSKFAAAAANPQNEALDREAVASFNHTMRGLEEGLTNYLMASLFLNVYQDGLKRQSLLQGLRMYVNLVATWVAFKSGHPLGIVVVGLTTLIQAFLQPQLAKKDKLDEQLNMIDLNIAAATDPKALADGWRSAEEVRYRQLVSLFKEDTKSIGGAAAKLVNMSATEWREFKSLDLRVQAGQRWNTLAPQFDAAAGKKDGASVAELQEQMQEARAVPDYARERQLSDELADLIGMARQDCYEYHDLSQRPDMRAPLSPDDQADYDRMSAHVDSNKPRDGKAAKFEELNSDYHQAAWDEIHMSEMNLDALSQVKDHFARAAAFLDLEGSAKHDLFSLSPEYRIGFVQEGNRRGAAFDENGAGFVAAMMRGYQLLFANVNGPVLINALYAMVIEILKQNNQEFKETSSMRAASTGLIGVLIAANALAAFSTRNASAIPRNVMQNIQALLSSAGSIAETVYQVTKLNVREELRNNANKNGAQKTALILGRTVENLAVLVRSGYQDRKAGKVADEAKKLLAALNDLRDASPENLRKLMIQSGAESTVRDATLLIEDSVPTIDDAVATSSKGKAPETV